MSSVLKKFQADLTKNPALPFHEPIQILLAEDDDGLREILQEYLNKAGRVLHSNKDGQEAIEALKGAFFDLVITDLMMPGADGIQILKEAKRLHPDVMVIIMTGYASLDTAIQAIRGGAYDYIRKPFKLDELEIMVSNACEKISLMRENRRLFEQLKEALGEIETLKKTWDERLVNILGICGMISDEKKNSEMEFLLNQIYPMPPDGDFKKQGSHGISFDRLERLVQLRKERWITEDEFLKWKALLLRGRNTDEIE